ncbi:HD domain-containing protein [Solitalea canadensis]|uniref:Putative HD superfamily hydrolase n=1 Tax=Solitalea canadensis (strain ATCC 29591 / DSM 3403 / JCM 21819 / LMG 8368 / NBRC 15130 / NCIMB 12057 / USAM 9D) TaxID=929556 RepID=H8KXZ3_SOLCM|nr:HD domain-containing protein [Solitalea canadensis]AFD05669.1 putative HD superfamily hydrolase [Solitalea canadensis DSM 3403]
MHALTKDLNITDRLSQQLHFILETDKLKQVIRRNFIADASRRENTAEHSWQIILITLTFSEYAKEKNMDLLRVIKMLTVHDLVEIYAGDVFLFDEQANVGKYDNETLSAERIFGILPADQKEEFISLWTEFEHRSTQEAIFANTIDRITPFLLNSVNGGQSWTEAGVRVEQALNRLNIIEQGSDDLWDLFLQLIEVAKNKSLLV